MPRAKKRRSYVWNMENIRIFIIHRNRMLNAPRMFAHIPKIDACIQQLYSTILSRLYLVACMRWEWWVNWFDGCAYLKSVSSSAKTIHLMSVRLRLKSNSCATYLNMDNVFAQWPVSVFSTLVLIVGIDGSAKDSIRTNFWAIQININMQFSIVYCLPHTITITHMTKKKNHTNWIGTTIIK